MAITTPVLGSTTLPQVMWHDGYSEGLELRGSDVIMASGAMKTDLVQTNAKRKFELKWRGLTETQVSTVESGWASVKTASASFTSPRGTTYTVTRDTGSNALELTWYKTASGMRADCSMRLREV